jgi:Trk-type K+ transport system membrane component
MGIIVLSIAILALFGGRRHAALQGRGAQPCAGQTQTPHSGYGGMILWKVYALFTAARGSVADGRWHEFFDAVEPCFHHHADGGFSTKNASVAHFDSLYIDMRHYWFSCCWPASIFPCITSCLRGPAIGFLERFGMPVLPGHVPTSDPCGRR